MAFLLLVGMLATATAEDVYPVYTYKESAGMHFGWLKSCMGRGFFDEGGAECVLLLAWTVETDDNYMSASNAGWSLVSDNTYYAFFPYRKDHYGVANTALPVTYDGQRQCGNNATTHLGAYDYMTARDEITTSSAQFNFSHLGCVVRLTYTVGRTMTVRAVSLSTEGESIVTKAVVDVPGQTMAPVQRSSVMTLATEDMEIVSGQTLIAYIMMYPADLAKETVTVRIDTDEGTFVERQLTGVAMQAGRLYDICLDDKTAGAKKTAGWEVNEDRTSETSDGREDNERLNESKSAVAVPETDESVSRQRCYAPDFTTAALGENELNVRERLLGDVNADGVVDLADARLLTNYNVGVRPVAIDLSVADTNEDGEITMADANKIVNISLSE